MHSPVTLMRAAGLTALSMATFALANCAAVPKSNTLTPLTPSDLASTQSLQGGVQGQWPARDWWKGFNDPQLTNLIDEALSHSPDLLAAQARISKAQAISDQVSAAMQPDLKFNTQLAEAKQSLNMGYPDAFKAFLPGGYLPLGRFTLDANYDLDLWGKSRAAVKAAVGNKKAAELDSEVARQNIAVAVTNAYVELNRLYETQDELAELAKGADIKIDLYTARAANNLDPQDVLLSAHDEKQQVAQRQAAVAGAIKMQQNLIAALVGAGPDRGLTIARPTLAPAGIEALPDKVPVDMLGRRPDVLAARLRVEAQAQGLKYAKADFYPNVNLSAYWGIQSLGLQHLGDPKSQIASIGPAISLPLFHQGRLSAEYHSYEADYNAAVAAYDQTLTTALHETADAATRTQSTAAEIAAVTGRRDAAQKSYDLTKARYGRGLATKMDLLTAHARVVTFESQLTDLEAQAYQDRIKFIAALGGGFQSN